MFATIGVMSLTPERHAQLIDELQRCKAYFTRLNTELDPTGRLRTSTLIGQVKHYIEMLQHELERNQAQQPNRNSLPPRLRAR